MNQRWRKNQKFLTQSFEILFLNKNTNKISKKIETKTISNKNNIDDKAFSFSKKENKLIFQDVSWKITLPSIKQQPFCNNSNSNIQQENNRRNNKNNTNFNRKT